MDFLSRLWYRWCYKRIRVNKMILQTLKKIYPDKSETVLKELEQDIRTRINGEIDTFELVDFATKLIMERTIEKAFIVNIEDDSKPTRFGDESFFLYEKYSEKKMKYGKRFKKDIKKARKNVDITGFL